MNKKILYGLAIVVVIIGIIMGVTKGFNLGLTYGSNEKIEVYLGKRASIEEITEISNQVFEKARIQTIEVFEDMGAITVTNATNEQLEKLVQIINEKYTQEYTVDDLNIVKVPSIQMWDLAKRYVLPVVLIIVICAIYLSIRFIKLSFWKVAIWTIINSVLAVAVYASAYLIVRIPVDEVTIPLGLAVLAGTLFITSNYFEKKLLKAKAEEQN